MKMKTAKDSGGRIGEMMIRNLGRKWGQFSAGGKVVRFVTLFFCLACFGSAVAAEQTAPASDGSGESGSLLSKIRKNHRKAAASERENDYFLIVKSKDGRGSAFLVRLWDQPVIVTNAHVFLSMEDPEIVDVNGRRYEPKEVLASKTRDLVIISYVGAEQEQRELLTVVGDAGALPINTKVIAYGNSLGDDVIVTQKGKLLGIGPDKIEVDAPFVPGNSGGPIVLDDGGVVIGVSTYLRFLKPDRSTTGSRYEVTAVTQQVRRFATRIDNIDPADLEPVFLEKLRAERELVRRSNDWINHIVSTCSRKYLSPGDYQEFRDDCLERSSLLTEGNAVDWSNTYLRNEFAKNREMIESVLDLLELDFLADVSRIDTILERHAAELVWTRMGRRQVRCFFCNGSGKHSIKRRNPEYTPQSAGPRWIIERHSCSVCDGTGRRLLWPEQICFSLPENVYDEVKRCIEPEEEPFCGFILGGEMEQELNRFPFYRKAPLYRIPNAFGETLVFVGNHADSNAASTALTFMFGRLLRVQITTPGVETASSGEDITFLPRPGEVADRPRTVFSVDDSRRSFRTPGMQLPGDAAFDVQVVRLDDRKLIPLDLRGNPLLKPIPPPQMEDDPVYDGFLVQAAHPCLRAINVLDLESLARKAKMAGKR